jgi:CxxC motif-containing protein (DUF1111 family)
LVVKLDNDPNFGNQLNPLGANNSKGEGDLFITWEEIEVLLDDGTAIKLRKPIHRLKLSGDGAEPISFSARVARQIVGMGLLEAISDETIKAQANCATNGTSGKVQMVEDPVTKETVVGRFGWKAGKNSIKSQVADAIFLDMGITSSVFTGKDSEPEINDEELDQIIAYVSLLGVPPRENPDDPIVVKGSKIFSSLGCPACHISNVTTGNHDRPALSNQTIHPYSDLLLHDMGMDLADGFKEGLAEGSEWRTAPLWGIGRLKEVHGEITLLHDGRAQSFEEAILWHGGEAEAATRQNKIPGRCRARPAAYCLPRV